MRRLEAGGVTLAMWTVAIVGFVYLLIPLVMIFPLSLETGSMLRFPPKNIGFHWFVAYLTDGSWMGATMVSLRVALFATIVATTVGVLASVGMHRQDIPGKNLFNIILVLPMMLPLVVVAISVYGVYASLGLVGTEFGIAMAHAVLCLPFVILNVNSALAALPRSYEEASLSLGASPITSLWLVTIPLIWRGIAAGAIFAFVISFDEVVIAMFLSSIDTTTLPKKMLDGIFFDLSPILAAISAVLIIFNIALALLGLALANKTRKRNA